MATRILDFEGLATVRSLVRYKEERQKRENQKPTLTKMVEQLESDPDNLELLGEA